MIVPQYWAEARLQHKVPGRQVTVRRFGWSDVSQADADANAQSRVQEAFERVLAGVTIPRREPKTAYNGAQGVPIREEIVARHGDTVITRNSYGARCLNTPNVFFADIDYDTDFGCVTYYVTFIVLTVCVAFASWYAGRLRLFFEGLFFNVFLAAVIPQLLRRLRHRLGGGAEAVALRRVRTFIDRHPDWYLRVYRTPAGLRVLAMQETFDPVDPRVVEAFQQLATDPIYARMCANQHCFRARVSPKPWRIGIHTHIKPRKGAWPIAPEKIPERNAWVEAYESASRDYAACTYVDSFGSGITDPRARNVQELHDELCQANSDLPIA